MSSEADLAIEILKRARKVRAGDIVLPEDVNTIAESAVYIVEALSKAYSEALERLPGDPDLVEGKRYVDEAKKRVQAQRRVSKGDIILPSDVNNLIDLLELIEKALGPLYRKLPDALASIPIMDPVQFTAPETCPEYIGICAPARKLDLVEQTAPGMCPVYIEICTTSGSVDAVVATDPAACPEYIEACYSTRSADIIEQAAPDACPEYVDVCSSSLVSESAQVS